MREIKFRAWDIQAKCILGGGGMQLNATTGRLDCLPSVVIMQYTGLKDKNGKEIYEGDIVQFYDRGNMFDDDLLLCTAQVTMRFAGWYPEPINVKGLRGFRFEDVSWRNEQCEVIGNIYENPELLRVK